MPHAPSAASSASPAHHPERGATLVEFAFVFPVLAFIVLVFIDFSLILAGNAAGSNAARDGARVGILEYQSADVDGSPSNIAIKNAVRARLGSMVKGDPVISIRCLKADTGSTVSCVRADGFGGVEADRDLLEVSVTWTQITVTPLVDPDHTEVVQMTITGKPDFSPDDSPLSVYFDDPDEDGVAAPVTAIEPQGTGNNTTVELTLHRSGDSTPTVTVDLGAGGASTASAADFIIPTPVVFAPGEKDKTVSITIIDDDLVEPDELLIVEIVNMTVTPSSASAVVGLPTSVRITIDSEDVDTTPPTPNGPRTYRETTGNVDGRIDMLSIQFSEPVTNPGSWTLVSSPSGGVLGSPSIGADPRVVLLPVSGASIATNGTWQVSGSGVTDAVGNTQPTGTLTLADAAPPVLVSVVSSGGAAGRAEQGDVVRFNFSDPVSVGAVGSLVLTNSGTNDQISVPGLLGATSTTGGNYNNPNGNGGNPITFPVAVVNAGNQLQLTLGACSPSNNCNALATVGGTPTLGFVLSGPVGVNDTLAAVLPTAPLQALLF